VAQWRAASENGATDLLLASRHVVDVERRHAGATRLDFKFEETEYILKLK
jgi:hypothetical protein